jgi:hypothetical protein
MLALADLRREDPERPEMGVCGIVVSKPVEAATPSEGRRGLRMDM